MGCYSTYSYFVPRPRTVGPPSHLISRTDDTMPAGTFISETPETLQHKRPVTGRLDQSYRLLCALGRAAVQYESMPCNAGYPRLDSRLSAETIGEIFSASRP